MSRMYRGVLWLSALCIWLAGCAGSGSPPERYGMVVKLKKERLEHYLALHADPWQGVMAQLDRSGIRNYSIWLGELEPDQYYLFGYFEYVGDDFDADMARMGDDAETRRWWRETDPCQQPVDTARPGQQWVMLEEVFFHDAGRPEARLMPAPPAFDAGKAK